MVTAGDIIGNPISGETFTFLKTAADTGGKLLQFDTRIRVGGGMAASLAHIHPLQEERLFIKSGSLRARVNGSEKVYRAGETLVIPANTPHQWSNDSVNEELHFINELEPALQWEDLFATVFAAARTGIASVKGEYPLLGMAVVLNKYRDHFYLASVPVRLQKILFALLSPVGKLLGYKEDYRYH